jgi:hypothetical protein
MKNLLRIFSYVGLLFCSYTYGQTNIGFESTSPGTYTASNSVSGWTLSSGTNSGSCTSSGPWTGGSSEFSIVATPVLNFPTIGNISNSPLGGLNIARLNNSTANGCSTKLEQTINVTYTNSAFSLAYCALLEDGGHNCCSQSKLTIQIKDSSGTSLLCTAFSLYATGSSCMPSNMTGYNVNNGFTWSNWQVKYIDLSPYFLQQQQKKFTVEIICSDCASGGHMGTAFFDMASIPFEGGCPNPTNLMALPVNYCAGSNIATIYAPLGNISYSWIPASGLTISPYQATLSSITITNPIPGSVYTLVVVASSGCVFSTAYVIMASTVSIIGLSSGSTCVNGASGSGTVFAVGSGAGYNYNWTNSTNSVVGTSSIVSGLSPGVYSVAVTASGSQSTSCGMAVSTITVNTAPPGAINMLKPYCSNQAYLYAPSGFNYQWYNNLTAISASLGGTASSLTVMSPSNGAIFTLAYLSSQGCQDSIRFALVQTTPGVLNVSSNPLICPGTSNGSITVSMVPTMGAPTGLNSFSVFSTGTATPLYSAIVNSNSNNTFSANNLVAGGTYSVTAFDGACKYSTSFSVTGFSFNYTISPGNSLTLCPGDVIGAQVTFTVPPSYGQYTYSWTPFTFLNSTSYPFTIVSPTVSQGNVTTVIYTVVVTPSIVNCPLTKTISITAANPAPPIISPVPALCKNAGIYTLSASPPGGTYSINNALTPGGLLTPSLAVTGTSTFTYAISVGSCVARSTATYIVNSLPVISISGNTSICEGQSTTLLAGGANNYVWNTNVSGPLLTVSPSVTTNYFIVGTNVVNSCTNSANISLQVLPLPQLNIMGDTTICQGETTTLIANGADLYSWSNGSPNQNITVAPLTNTTYTLTGTSAAGCVNSKITMLSVSPCIGINAINSDQYHMKIYPNPNNGKLIIETSEPGEISIYEFTGKMIRTEKLISGLQIISVDDLENGIYILKSIIGNKITTTKLLKD